MSWNWVLFFIGLLFSRPRLFLPDKERICWREEDARQREQKGSLYLGGIMYNQHFGVFLLKQNLLTKEQLADAMSAERAVKRSVGFLALDAGMMTVAQVHEVQQEQWSTGKRFSEIAYELGYLSIAQLEDLMLLPITAEAGLGSVAVQRHYLSLMEWEQAVADYRRECELTQGDQYDDSQQLDYEAIVEVLMDVHESVDNTVIMQDYLGLLLRNLVIFLGEEPAIWETFRYELAVAEKRQGPVWHVAQRIIIGGKVLQAVLAFDESTLLSVARGYSEEELTEVNELALDSVREFFSMHNGLFTVNYGDGETDPYMEVAELGEGYPAGLSQGHLVPIGLQAGRVELIMTI